jgi:hypothetical protein
MCNVKHAVSSLGIGEHEQWMNIIRSVSVCACVCVWRGGILPLSAKFLERKKSELQK